MPKLRCPGCQSVLTIPESMLGRKLNCPDCTQAITTSAPTAKAPTETKKTPAATKPQATQKARPTPKKAAQTSGDDFSFAEENVDDSPRPRRSRRGGSWVAPVVLVLLTLGFLGGAIGIGALVMMQKPESSPVVENKEKSRETPVKTEPDSRPKADPLPPKETKDKDKEKPKVKPAPKQKDTEVPIVKQEPKKDPTKVVRQKLQIAPQEDPQPITRGDVMALQVVLEQTGIDGDILVEVDKAPEGITVEPITLKAGQTKALLPFFASNDVPERVHEIEVRASAGTLQTIRTLEVRLMSAEPTKAMGSFQLEDRDAKKSAAVAVTFSPDGKRIGGFTQKGANIWDATTGKVVTYAPLSIDPRKLLVRPNMAMRDDGSALMFPMDTLVKTYACMHVRDGKGVVDSQPVQESRDLAVHCGNDLEPLLCNHKGEVTRMKSQDKVRFVIGPKDAMVKAAAFSGDGTRLVACAATKQGEENSNLVLYDVLAEKSLLETKGPPASADATGDFRMALTPDGSRCVYRSSKGLQVWDLKTNKVTRLFGSDKDEMIRLVGNDRVVSLTKMGTKATITFRNLNTGRRMGHYLLEDYDFIRFPLTAQKVVLSPDGSLLAAGPDVYLLPTK